MNLFSPTKSNTPLVKIPERGVVEFDASEISVDQLEFILFQSIGAMDIIGVSRHDVINGESPYYGIISNLSSLRYELDPNVLISKQRKGDSIYRRYTINLDEKIPSQEYLEENNLENFFYIAQNGDLIIEVVDMKVQEEVEIEIATNATIYEGE